jgi:hypothetical protein
VSRREPSPEGKRRQLEGSRRGAEVVRADFAALITRRRYCELVGIHGTTLRKWEQRGLVRPEVVEVMNSPTHVYTDEDVRFGKRLIGLLRSRPGEMSIEEAAALASREP